MGNKKISPSLLHCIHYTSLFPPVLLLSFYRAQHTKAITMGAPLTEVLSGSASSFLLSLGKRETQSQGIDSCRAPFPHFSRPSDASMCQSKGKSLQDPRMSSSPELWPTVSWERGRQTLANANNWKLGLYPSRFTTHLLCLHFIIKQKWYVLILKCPQICCQEKLWHDLKS